MKVRSVHLGVFLAASALGMTLFVGRWVVTHRVAYGYLPWNLFLAWIPLVLALLTAELAEGEGRLGWLAWIAAISWLLFFPNAPYILTDLMHLAGWRYHPRTPLWFDVQLNLLFALTGLMLGFASLAVMQRVVRQTLGRWAEWGFVLAALGLGGLGVYIGRFLRWNSWDVLTAPTGIAADLVHILLRPRQNVGAYAFTLMSGALLLVTYLMVRNLTPGLAEESRPSRPEKRRAS